MTRDPCKGPFIKWNALLTLEIILWRPEDDDMSTMVIPCEPTDQIASFVRNRVHFGCQFFGVN